MGCDCYKIGGPFIDVDPDCPVHAPGGLRDQEEAREEFQAEVRDELAALRKENEELKARLKRLENRVLHARKK